MKTCSSKPNKISDLFIAYFDDTKIAEKERNLVIERALEEDFGKNLQSFENLDAAVSHCDLTSRTGLPAGQKAHAYITAKESGILSGIDLAIAVFEKLSPELKSHTTLKNGSEISKGQHILEIEGPLALLLAGERTALNFLGSLSAVATLTHAYVKKVAGTRAKIMGTRKTLPGLRYFQKRAIIDGGGHPHRYGLFDAILTKDNHLAAWKDNIQAMLENVAEQIKTLPAREQHNCFTIVEVDRLDQLERILELSENLHPNRVLLDNMDCDTLREAVIMIDGRFESEASGGVTLETVAEIARTGVDAISAGALTHSAGNFDFGMEINE